MSSICWRDKGFIEFCKLGKFIYTVPVSEIEHVMSYLISEKVTLIKKETLFGCASILLNLMMSVFLLESGHPKHYP
mgnify:CR=1 FL=1